MKTPVHFILALAAILTLSNCANAGMGMGGLAMGQRSAKINDLRSRPEALTSSAQLSQSRKQRANELEEARAQRELRGHDLDATLHPLRSISAGLGAIGGIKSSFNGLGF